MSGTLHYRLVVVDPAGATFTPGDVSIGEDHFWVTSRRLADHPYIEAPPSGDGQAIDPVTGKVTDGEYRVRVIDVPEPTCTLGTSAMTEDIAGDTLFTNGWRIYGDTQGSGYPAGSKPAPNNPDAYGAWWSCIGCTNPPVNPAVQISGFVFGTWNDDGMLNTLGPWIRSTWMQKTYSGFTPGERVGFHANVTWSLDTGAGGMFMEVNGERVSIPSNGYDLWTIDPSLGGVQDGYAAGNADGSGEVTVKIGIEGYTSGSNIIAIIEDVEIVTCIPGSDLGTGSRYVTRWLADVSARQQLLGRRAYVEQSRDDGATWTMLRAGYLTSLVMEHSLVYEFAIGDTRRVERTKAAWRDLDPLNESVAAHITALIGGPVYGGFPPYSPRHALPMFRVVDSLLATTVEGVAETANGWCKLNYRSGPMPPGFRPAGSNHSVNLVRRTVNERAQPYFDAEGTWDGAYPSGSFPGLTAAIFDATDGSVIEEGMTPLGLNFRQIVLGGSSGRLATIERGQELINTGLEVALRWDRKVPFSTLIGTDVLLLIAPTRPSDQFPLYWRGHPVDLETALLARHDIPYDTTTAASVKAALGADLVTVMRFTDPAQTIADVLDELHAMFGYTSRVDASGQREFVTYRPLVASAPALSIVTNDLRAEGGPTYRLDEDSRRNRLVVTQQYFRTLSPDDEGVIDAPDMVTVVEGARTFDYSSDGGATLDAEVVGPREVSLSLGGHVALASDVTTPGDLEASSPISQTQWGQGLARLIFAQNGRGVQEATIVTRRDAADADAANIADPVALDADHVPNAQIANSPTSQRGGERWWRVIQRTESPEGAELLLADAGTGVAYGEAVTLTVYPDDYDPGYFYRVEITDSTALHTDGAWLELQVALQSTAPTGDGVSYTVLDGAQFEDGTAAVLDPYPVRLGPFPLGETLWVRARGFLVGGSPGAWSAWTSLGGSQTTCPGDICNLILYPVFTDGATLTWTNNDATNQIRVSYRLNDTGAYTVFGTYGIGTATATLTGLALDSLYGVKVARWNGSAEVGTPLTAQFRTLPGELSALTQVTNEPSYAIWQWGNTHPTADVKVEYRLTGTPTWSLVAVLQPTSRAVRIAGLSPSTDYDIKVVLLQANGAEFGTPLTDTWTTPAASGTLGAPTNPAVFAGVDPSNGGFARGLYGLRVYADTTNPPHAIVIEEAVETAIGSGTPGAYSEVTFIPAQYGGATLYTATAPNDLKLRYIRAFARLSGWTDSSKTTALSVDPWGVTQPPTGPIGAAVQFSELAAAEDSQQTGDFPIAPGSTLTQVSTANSKSCRVRLYESDAARTADAARDIVQLPIPGSGVILDVVMIPGFYTIDLNPQPVIVDRSDPPLPEVTVYYLVDCYEPGTNDYTITIRYSLGAPAPSGPGTTTGAE